MWSRHLHCTKRSAVQVYALRKERSGLLDHHKEYRFYMAWMYILKCVDDSYYVGSTKNLELRLSQHQEGVGARYTARRLPVELVYSEEYDRVVDAFIREKQVQNWSRAKREALIHGETDLLPVLAKKKFSKSLHPPK